MNPGWIQHPEQRSRNNCDCSENTEADRQSIAAKPMPVDFWNDCCAFFDFQFLRQGAEITQSNIGTHIFSDYSFSTAQNRRKPNSCHKSFNAEISSNRQISFHFWIFCAHIWLSDRKSSGNASHGILQRWTLIQKDVNPIYLVSFFGNELTKWWIFSTLKLTRRSIREDRRLIINWASANTSFVANYSAAKRRMITRILLNVFVLDRFL